MDENKKGPLFRFHGFSSVPFEIIYLFNFADNLFLFKSQCPEDSYIADGYPCNQTETVRLTVQVLRRLFFSETKGECNIADHFITAN